MSDNQQQPYGQPFGQQPPAGTEEKPKRVWFKKKRVIIPAGVLALLIGIGSCGGGEDTVSSDQTSQVEETTAAAEPTVDAEAAAEAEAEAAKLAEAEAEAKAAEEAEAKAAEEAEAAQKAEEKAAAKKAEEEAAAAAEAAKGTISQQNALRSAESYISFKGFSRTGLIGQLEFEEFSTEDATWAVDNLEVDWNEQAVKSGESYLSFKGFSRQGLIDQLIFEGYTPEQAAHGATENGL